LKSEFCPKTRIYFSNNLIWELSNAYNSHPRKFEQSQVFFSISVRLWKDYLSVGKVAASRIFWLKFEMQRNCLNCSYEILHTCSKCYGLHFLHLPKKNQRGPSSFKIGFIKNGPHLVTLTFDRRDFGQQQSCSGWKIIIGGENCMWISQCKPVIVIFWVAHQFSKSPEKIGNAHSLRSQIWSFLLVSTFSGYLSQQNFHRSQNPSKRPPNSHGIAQFKKNLNLSQNSKFWSELFSYLILCIMLEEKLVANFWS
jgi:hypothetical protein